MVMVEVKLMGPPVATRFATTFTVSWSRPSGAAQFATLLRSAALLF